MSIVDQPHILAFAAIKLPGELWLLPLLVLSLAAAAFSRVLPPRRVAGRDRIPPERSPWPLVGVLFGALGVYLFSLSFYETIKHPHSSQIATTQAFEPPPAETAFVSTVPPLLGFLALLLGSYFAAEVSPRDLGLSLRRLRGGAAWGSIGVVIVVPPLYLAAEAVEWIYRRVHYRHPAEHPFLHTLGEKPGAPIVAAIVVGACVIAPLFEELLFRGFLQTLFRRMFHFLSGDSVSAGGFPVIPAATTDAADVPIPEMPPPNALHTWAAIVVTSALFAWVHPAWSRPVIFLLAVCLGYAYERTSNLWVPITIHAGFNTLSIAVYLLSLYAS
ncbi:MAG TPA: CPBP family intramembrane glutamic endopeptidase [Tepidisphaeraceae bacterium]|nr:CPBP family intramembrane glutamic endopeptidase [Tepidisphaeraceae bacterium]